MGRQGYMEIVDFLYKSMVSLVYFMQDLTERKNLGRYDIITWNYKLNNFITHLVNNFDGVNYRSK